MGFFCFYKFLTEWNFEVGLTIEVLNIKATGVLRSRTKISLLVVVEGCFVVILMSLLVAVELNS